MIETRTAAIVLRVRKRIDRDPAGRAKRVTEAVRDFDISPFLGDFGSVTTSTRIGEPFGSFAITLSSATDDDTRATLDNIGASLEAMDYIELCFSARPGKPPVVMRGFISRVTPTRAMGPEGKPHHSVTIAGEDLGRVATMASIFARADYAPTDGWQTSFQLAYSTGFTMTMTPASNWLQTLIVEGLLNKFIGSINQTFQGVPAAQNDPQRPPTATDIIPYLRAHASVASTVSPQGMQTFQGRIQEMMDGWADKDWNELFYHDDPKLGPGYIYRPKPYSALGATGDDTILGGNKPWLKTSAGTVRIIDADDILDYRLTRSDNEVVNFALVTPVLLDNTYEAVMSQQLASRELFDDGHPNNDRRLYGLRRMDVSTHHKSPTAAIDAAQYQEQSAALVDNATPAGRGELPPPDGYEHKPEYLKLRDFIAQVEVSNGIPHNVLARLINNECSFTRGTIYGDLSTRYGGDNAYRCRGPGQFQRGYYGFNSKGVYGYIRGTADDYGLWSQADTDAKLYNQDGSAGDRRCNPALAIPAAGRYLASLLRQFGNIVHAVAAYNYGPRYIKEYIAGKHGVPTETVNYVRDILRVQLSRSVVPPGADVPDVAAAIASAGLLPGAEDLQRPAPVATDQPGPPYLAVDGQEASVAADTAWINTRRAQLFALNRDNAVFETGTIVVKGDERLLKGHYVLVRDGRLTFEVYIEGVAHDVQPLGSFVTTLQVVRGTAFYQRLRFADGSPAAALAASGVYS